MITVMPHGHPERSAPLTRHGTRGLGDRYGFGCAGPRPRLHPSRRGDQYLIDAVAEIEAALPTALPTFNVLITGQVRERRGVLRLLRARGSGTTKPRLHRQCRRAGLEATSRFIGFVPADRHELAHAVRVLRCPAVCQRAQSGVLDLLVAAGTPVIATTLPGLAGRRSTRACWSRPGRPRTVAPRCDTSSRSDAARDSHQTDGCSDKPAITFGSLARHHRDLRGAGELVAPCTLPAAPAVPVMELARLLPARNATKL